MSAVADQSLLLLPAHSEQRLREEQAAVAVRPADGIQLERLLFLLCSKRTAMGDCDSLRRTGSRVKDYNVSKAVEILDRR